VLICVRLWFHSLDAFDVSAVGFRSLMELEFDKEIDALLRKARDSERVGKTDGAHLDADAMVAFTENSLPAGMRRLYTEHLADCGRCRKLLSHSVLMNDAVVAQEPTAVVAPVAAAVEPWYAGIFKLPKLALSMGALVVLFAGGLTVLVVQNRLSGPNAEVSQVTNNQRSQAPAMANAPVNATSAAAPIAMNSNTAVANSTNTSSATTSTETGTLSTNTAANTTGFGAPVGGKPAEAFKEDNKLALDAAKPQAQPETGATGADRKSAIAAAPPPVPATGGAVPADEKKEAEERQEAGLRRAEKTAEKAKDRDDARSRVADSPAAAAKSGPARTGPLQNQSNQVYNSTREMAVTRNVGGKSFVNRNGAWYDTAYNNQRTQNYHRGTAEYEKLDKNIRSIAKELGGTVVVVWKGTAYRID